MIGKSLIPLAAAWSLCAEAADLRGRASSKTPTATTPEPDWFQPPAAVFAGTTATGSPPLLVGKNPTRFQGEQFQPNEPLQTNEPIQGAHGRNIFQLMGQLSPYFVPDDGFGVDEYPLPKGAEIKQVYLLHRHGSRYPSDAEATSIFAEKIANATAQGIKFTGELSILNDLKVDKGVNSLVAKGREELFESGVLHYYNYGALSKANSSSKLVVRATSIERAEKSAENFLAGFFGLDWKDNAEILTLISGSGFNSSLTGIGNCPNSAQVFSSLDNEAMRTWQGKYLADRTAHLSKLAGGLNWTVDDTYNLQTLCAYETVISGYSPSCQLFTYQEWEGYSYSWAILFSSLLGFASPVGRANGAGWVAEFIARAQGHLLDVAPGLTSANLTLGQNPITFPLDQTLYFDFGHDSSIIGALTGFGFRQFAESLPASGPPPNRRFYSERIAPFAGRLNIEIIKAPHAVNAQRDCDDQQSPYDRSTGSKTYVHFMLNQRTLPLHASFPECEKRDDGWCELSTFLKVAKDNLGKAQYIESCFGDWKLKDMKYGTITDGVPVL